MYLCVHAQFVCASAARAQPTSFAVFFINIASQWIGIKQGKLEPNRIYFRVGCVREVMHVVFIQPFDLEHARGDVPLMDFT